MMTKPQSVPDPPNSVVHAIDRMVDRINRFKVEPEFTREIHERSSKLPNFAMDDREIFRRLVVLIAYSNNANSLKVTRLVESDAFESMLQNYFIAKWPQFAPGGACGSEDKTAEFAKAIIDGRWPDLRPIRFRYKVEAWARCAKCLLRTQLEHGSFMTFLKCAGLPSILQSECDIRIFWDSFNQVRHKLRGQKFPYFANFTSLCHLLLDLGFDCAKPDLIVMKSAVDLGIVPPPPKKKRKPDESGSHPEESLGKAVRTIQIYAVHRGMRVPVVDLYFLIHGGQADSRALVKPEYYH